MDELMEKYQSAALAFNMKRDHISMTGNLLILTDRLNTLARQLASCINLITDVNVIGIISNHKEIEMFENCSIDYLIVVGYLRCEKNYHIIDELRLINRNMKTVIWALSDEFINYICNKQKIFFKYDRSKRVDEFVNYLLKIEESDDFYMQHTSKFNTKSKKLLKLLKIR